MDHTWMQSEVLQHKGGADIRCIYKYVHIKDTGLIICINRKLILNHQDWKPRPEQLPEVIEPPGLPQERQKYLHDKIRDFVPDACKDSVCPPPHTHDTSQP